MIGSAGVFGSKLLRWFDRHGRDLPWRLGANAPAGARLDPYHVLVSETMLQQTQVATVIPYFRRFIGQFPTMDDLAGASEQQVLRLWQGLGYYARARHLQAAARQVVDRHKGLIPQNLDDLMDLPGVGRYTAGAIASIAFGQKAPIVDGNVMRVLCRLDCIRTDPRERSTVDYLWRRAEEILPGRRIGDFNSALMELGATVCLPRNPQCHHCPVRAHCQAHAAGLAEALPIRRQARAIRLERRITICIQRNGRWLIEQRPSKGRWAGMWQFVTVERDKSAILPADLCGGLSIALKNFIRLGQVKHVLTHRRYEFTVYRADAVGAVGPHPDLRRRAWVSPKELNRYPMPKPHLKIAKMSQGNPKP